MKISTLKNQPHFADTVADRGWHAWWTESGTSVADYRAHLEPMIEKEGIPFGLVAHDEGIYLGSVLVIENDLDDRPQYTPWIAALWVDLEWRTRGIGTSLLAAAYAEASRLKQQPCYLCARPDKTAYYLARGFTQIEEDVSGVNIFTI
jgi:GNAT superfamily N-acetyltransferase